MKICFFLFIRVAVVVVAVFIFKTAERDTHNGTYVSRGSYKEFMLFYPIYYGPILTPDISAPTD